MGNLLKLMEFRTEGPIGEKTNLSDNNLKKRGEYSSEYKDK